MALRGEGGRIRPLIAIVQTRYAPPPPSISPTPSLHPLPHLHPISLCFPLRSISRLTSHLFCTLTCCFFPPNHSPSPIIFHFHVSPHMYHQDLCHTHLFLFLATPPPSPYRTYRHSHIDFQIHFTAIIDSFHYLVVLVRMRCLKPVNILTAPTIS